MHHYSFINESAILTALGLYGLGSGAYHTVKNAKQNSFNNRYVKLMIKELSSCNDRQSAIQILNKYCTQIARSYTMVDKDTQQKVLQMQNFININFRIPLTQIINNQNDQNWKQNMLQYINKNSSKINRKNLARTALSGTAITAGSALMGGGALVGGYASTLGQAAIMASQGIMYINLALKQLKIFNSTRYIQKMYSEIEKCPDNNKQMAIDIINRYCYDISNNIQSIVNKTGKKINFDIQLQMRNQFLIPLMNIVNQPNNAYWKIQLLDEIKTHKLQGIIQHICDSISQLLLPYVMRKYVVSQRSIPVKNIAPTGK